MDPLELAKSVKPVNINNPMSVFPKPQRMFPEDAPVKGGQYLSMPDKTDMTGHKAAAASIGVAQGGKPFFTASRDAVDETGTSGRGTAIAKTNLFKQKAGWKWKDAPEGHEDTNTIVSVEHRGKHHYALNAHFPKGVDLARYEDSPSEPRLRPTTRGNVEFGPQAGSILVRGREHPVYHHIIVKADGGDVEGYATKGAVPDPLELAKSVKPISRNRAEKVSYVVDHDRKEVRAHGPNGNEIGYLSMEKYGEPAKNNEVFNMAVKPAWQGKGIMRNLHDTAEQHFGTINPSRTLSDDGVAFWKSYRPEAVKDSYRFHADKIIGQPAQTRSGMGTVSSVGDKNMIATLPNGNTSMVHPEHAKALFEQAQKSDTTQ